MSSDSNDGLKWFKYKQFESTSPNNHPCQYQSDDAQCSKALVAGELELTSSSLFYPRCWPNDCGDNAAALPTNIRSRRRGICLVFNQKNFHPSTGQSCREGTDVDAETVQRTFTALGFQVERFTDLGVEGILRQLKTWGTYDHSQFDSFVCVFLSHGDNDLLYGFDAHFPTDALFRTFKGDLCPSLVGKPKIFFIQACRGTYFDQGALLATDAPASNVLVYKLPIEADILVAFSTVPGYFAWRNSTCGSWFIQEVCRVLDQDALIQKQKRYLLKSQVDEDKQLCHEQSSSSSSDLVSLLTLVARRVAYSYRSNTRMTGSHNMCQMTSTVSTLTRLVDLTSWPN